MTNNDELALKLKAAAEIIGSETWHTEGSNVWNDEYEVNGEYSSDLIACCENVNNESVHADFIATASPANILALLAERDADKKRIAEQQEIIAKQEKWIKDIELTMIAATDRAEDAEKRNAAMSQAYLNLKHLIDVYLHAYEEAKASVAELEARTVSVKLPEPATEGGRGYRQKVIWVLKEALFDAGINLEVGE